MAIHNNLVNRINGLDVPWEGKTGLEVEDFISKRLKNPLNPKITYDELILTIYNPEGDPIASGPITVVPPNYTTDILFEQLSVNGITYTSDVEVNYTNNISFIAGFNVKTFYESTGNIYNLSSKVTVTFYIEGTTDLIVFNDIVPNKDTDDSLLFRDITDLFEKNLQGAKVKAVVTANGKTSESTYAGDVTVHKIELSTNSTNVDNKTLVFNITGLTSTDNMQLEYFDVPLGADISQIKKLTENLSGISSTDLVLSQTEGYSYTGIHLIIARISNTEGTYYSNWVQANVISYDSNHPESMAAIIGGVPKEISNCENANLYKIIYVPGLGGDIEIISYLADEPGIFGYENWDDYIFNLTSIKTTANDEPNVLNYYSYIELKSVKNSLKAIAFKLKINEKEYPIYHNQRKYFLN